MVRGLPNLLQALQSLIRHPPDSQGLYEQRSNVRSVYSCSCELSELVHWSLGVLCAPGQLIKSRDILGVYAQHLNWYDGIPDVLKLGQNFTPAAFFVQ